jgi:uncharacterized membrane protein YdjX (TVP38/TMEM64 family)
VKRALRILPLAVLAAASAAAILLGGERLLDLDRLLASRAALQAYVAQDRGLAMLAAYGAHVATIVLAMPVSALMTTIHGFLFGWAEGALLAVASTTSGALLVFAVAKTALGDAVARRAGPRLAKLRAGFERDAFSYVLVLRLLPIVPFWVTNIAAPVLGARLKAFAPATVLGIIPASLAFATAGSGIEGVVAAHEAARTACLASGDGAPCVDALTVRALVTPKLVISLAALAVLALLPVVIRQWRRGGPAA